MIDHEEIFLKELWASLVTAYNDYRGTGKLLALFLVSVLIIYLLKDSHDTHDTPDHSGTLVHPFLFVLSPMAGIGYAFTLVFERYLGCTGTRGGGKKTILYKIIMAAFIFLTLSLSGRFVFLKTETDGMLPFLLIPVYFAVYILLAHRLFADRGSKWFMAACILVLNLWGYQSEALLPVTMFAGRFSLPVIIVHGVLPIILWVLIDKYDKYMESSLKPDTAGMEETDYYEWEEEDMKNHKIINSRNIAIALLVVVIMLFGSVFVMNRKINNLYMTTVNLQEQVEELKNKEAK